MTSLFSGWGGSPVTAGRLRHAGSRDDVAGIVGERHARGTVARGFGRSYGDAAQRAGGQVVDVTGLCEIGPIDDRGRVRLSAGTSLAAVIDAAVGHGWFLPALPGTSQVTVAGAVAADVHGKNHHVDGSFGDHVVSIDLLTPDGQVQRLLPRGESSELFWATVGGMGLTGVILAAEVQLTRVDGRAMRVDTDRLDDLDAVLGLMDDDRSGHRYSVAWLDAQAHGPRLGRGVVTRADHAPSPSPDEPGPPHGPRHDRAALRVPFTPPVSLLRPRVMRALAEARFRRAPQRRRDQVMDLAGYFHPLDRIGGWNRLYGPRGFVQYQFVVPADAVGVIETALETFSTSPSPAYLAVLKRMGPGNPGLLSFPRRGWTLALDIPVADPEVAARLDALDELVAAAGGRVYLAKDARLGPGAFARMYPEAPAFREIRRRVDPDGVVVSDLARRLGLA